MAEEIRGYGMQACLLAVKAYWWDCNYFTKVEDNPVQALQE